MCGKRRIERLFLDAESRVNFFRDGFSFSFCAFLVCGLCISKHARWMELHCTSEPVKGTSTANSCHAIYTLALASITVLHLLHHLARRRRAMVMTWDVTASRKCVELVHARLCLDLDGSEEKKMRNWHFAQENAFERLKQLGLYFHSSQFHIVRT